MTSRVLWAGAGSLVLHGGLLLLVARMGQPPPSTGTPSPSATRVVLFDVVRPVKSGNESPAPKPRAVEPSRGGARPPAPVPVAASVPDAVAPAPAPASVAQAGEDPARDDVDSGEALGWGAPGGGAAAAETGSAPADGARSGAAGSDEPGPAIAALHQRLQDAVLHCYPAAASRFRVRGEVVISFCLDAVGNPTSVAQVASSGSALLDRAATGCVLPGALPVPGAAGCYRVPIVFGTP